MGCAPGTPKVFHLPQLLLCHEVRGSQGQMISNCVAKGPVSLPQRIRGRNPVMRLDAWCSSSTLPAGAQEGLGR